jgi:hypothetical protein
VSGLALRTELVSLPRRPSQGRAVHGTRVTLCKYYGCKIKAFQRRPIVQMRLP